MNITNEPVVLLVNCYNSELYLSSTLESLVRQSYDNVTIVVVDNVSSDSTKRIAKDYQSHYSFVHYTSLDRHVTLVEARIQGIDFILKNFEFSYLGFCDSDDLWEPHWVSSLMSLNYNSCYDILYSSGFELYMLPSDSTRLEPVDKSLAKLPQDAYSSPLYLQSYLVSRRLLKRMQPNILDPRLSLHSDIDFLHNAVRKYNASYAHTSHRLFYYRVHHNSLSSKRKNLTKTERYLIMKKQNFSRSIHFLKLAYYEAKLNLLIGKRFSK